MVLNIILNIVFLKYFFDYTSERRPGAGHRHSLLYGFFRAFYYFSVALWQSGYLRIARSFAKIALCLRDHGCRVLARHALHRFTMHSRFIVQLLVFLVLLRGSTGSILGLAWFFRCHELEESLWDRQ